MGRITNRPRPGKRLYIRRKHSVKQPCAMCGRTFASYAKNVRFCCDSCKVKAHRLRRLGTVNHATN